MRLAASLLALIVVTSAAPGSPAAPGSAQDGGTPRPGSPGKPGAQAASQPAETVEDSVYERLPAAYPTPEGLREIRGLLAAARIDAWLLTDFRGDNPTALDVLRPARKVERRWFYLIPARGDPTLIVHTADADAFAGTPGRQVTYTTHADLATLLTKTVRGRRRVAVESTDSLSSPLTRFDATVAEVLGRAGARLVSSGDIRLQHARWEGRAGALYLEARRRLQAVLDEAIELIVRHIAAGRPIDEVTVEKAMYRSLRARGLETESPPAVAAGRNTAIPEYVATVARTSPIRRGDLVVIRLAARVRAAGAPYAVLTHVAYAGDRVPEPMARAYAAARAAADAAVALVRERQSRRQPLRAYEVDAAARKVLVERGYGKHLLHPTGHALETRFPGTGLSLDDYDRRDTRLVQRGLALRISPGVYVAQEFGLRAERAILVGEKDVTDLDPGAARIRILLPGPASDLMEME